MRAGNCTHAYLLETSYLKPCICQLWSVGKYAKFEHEFGEITDEQTPNFMPVVVLRWIDGTRSNLIDVSSLRCAHESNMSTAHAEWTSQAQVFASLACHKFSHAKCWVVRFGTKDPMPNMATM